MIPPIALRFASTYTPSAVFLNLAMRSCCFASLRIIISSSNVLLSSSSTPPMGSRSSSSADVTDDGGLPIHASRGGEAEVRERRKRERRGTRVSVDSRARV